MAITGTGTEQDPYIVTTYDELVEKAAESGKFVKIGNDINITAEYPSGDMPTLVVEANIDGDGKTVSNWYKTTSGYCITWTSGSSAVQIKNLVIGNIYITAAVTAFFYDAGHTVAPFLNCKFYGVLYNYFKDGITSTLKDCSLNLDLRKELTDSGATIANFDGIAFNNCYVRLKDTAATRTQRSLFPNFYTNPFAKDSYFEIVTTAEWMTQYLQGQGAENSVFDIRSSATWTWGNATGYSCSIFRLSSAPNFTGSNNIKAVEEEYWLDVEYLAEIGFNAG